MLARSPKYIIVEMRTYKILFWIGVFTTIGLFIFLRWYRLDQSLFFQNDIGRDFLVLYDWQQSGKPPQLGPQTSIISFNQSAFYYYLLFPLFVIFHHAVFVNTLTLMVVSISLFLAGLYLLRDNKHLQISFVLVSLLLTLQPEIVLENRYVWNPSFMPIFLVASFFLFLALQKNFSKKNLAVFSLSCALAVGMSIVAIPAVIAFILLALILFRQKLQRVGQIVVGVVTAHFVVFLPFLIFEIRHHFQITSRILSQQETFGQGTNVLQKVAQLQTILLQGLPWQTEVLLVIIGICMYILIRHATLNYSAQAVFLFLVTTAIVLLLPAQLVTHHFLASLTLFLLVIATLPLTLSLPIIFVVSFFWLQPPILQSHFQTTERTFAQLNTCFADFCALHQEPLFVSDQSDYHNFHSAPEFRYLMKDHACVVKDIETEPTAAQSMAIVVDHGSYTQGQTSYNELTLFGPSMEKSISTCSATFRIHVIQKL